MLLCGGLGPSVAALAEAQAGFAATCELGADQVSWLQRALDAWTLLTSEILDIPSRPLPWIVTFDERCVWHVASPEGLPEGSSAMTSSLTLDGRAVRVRSLAHDGEITLPSGTRIPARAMAFASLWNEGRSTFFVLAMRSLWHRDQPKSRAYDLDDFFLGIAGHEMVHTRQLVAMNRRIEAIGDDCELPEQLGDASIEEHFAADPSFARALSVERRLFFEAAAADPERRVALAGEALRHLRERRRRYFTAEVGCFGDVEDLLLALEGTAVWAHYQLARREPEIVFLPDRPDLVERRDVLEFLLARDADEWVQEVGFPLVLLLDDLAPDWQDRMLGSELASPVELLEEALRRSLPLPSRGR